MRRTGPPATHSMAAFTVLARSLIEIEGKKNLRGPEAVAGKVEYFPCFSISTRAHKQQSTAGGWGRGCHPAVL